ncbi:benzoate para-hydroxylase [Rhodocollybia butyracea]|uniref:Benzoate para-hydroxylase n=1 Tax=Rhodocollybia butyracea TaxID=206335 RepID=A0A9P5PJY1_9AGAR|nr:benzoate para-hydroxylase [Rhodocollybia butyracea]
MHYYISFGLSLLLGLLVLLGSYVWVKSRTLNHIPGPILARLTPLWLIYYARIGKRYMAVECAHKVYGDMVLISPNHVSICHPEAIKAIYGNGPNALVKSQFYNAFISLKPSVFSVIDSREHTHRRRILSKAFSSTALQSFIPTMKHHVSAFTSKIDSIAARSNTVDLLAFINYLTVDILSDLAFGAPLGFLEQESDLIAIKTSQGRHIEEHFSSMISEREHLAAVLGISSYFRYLSPILFDPFIRRARKSSSSLEQLAYSKVLERFCRGQNKDDILQRLIDSHGTTEHHQLGDRIEILTAETVTLLIAGSDSTANSIAAILHLVLIHPEVHKKLLLCLEDAVGSHKGPIEFKQIANVAYLSATIIEGLRYHSINSIGLPREVSSHGLVILGKYLPPGTEVSVPAWTAHHSNHIWGDPQLFRPERWLESDIQQCFLGFGKGKRACIGKHLAQMQMQLILSTIMLRYDMELESKDLLSSEGFLNRLSELKVFLIVKA